MEGVGLCLYTVTATELLTQNKRYMSWLQQHDSHTTLREESLYNYVMKTLLVLDFFFFSFYCLMAFLSHSTSTLKDEAPVKKICNQQIVLLYVRNILCVQSEVWNWVGKPESVPYWQPSQNGWSGIFKKFLHLVCITKAHIWLELTSNNSSWLTLMKWKREMGKKWGILDGGHQLSKCSNWKRFGESWSK